VSEPIRSCVGCGRRGQQRQFLRFVAKDGKLVTGAGLPGRGAYTCRRLSCFERAVSRRAFNRALRQRVEIEQNVAALYT
jgi:uncharacterized protein